MGVEADGGFGLEPALDGTVWLYDIDAGQLRRTRSSAASLRREKRPQAGGL